MKKFTILFLVIAIVALAVTPTFAAKGKTPKSQPIQQSMGTQRAELDEPVLIDNSFAVLQAPKLNKARSSKATALSGTYTIGVGGSYTTLKQAVTDLQASGVSGAVVFEFTDALYLDSAVTIGGYTGQSTFPVSFQLAGSNPSAVVKIVAGLLTETWGVAFNGAQNVTWQGSTAPWVKGSTTRPLTVEVDTLALRRNVFVVINGCYNVNLKDMELVGWRRGTGTIGPGTAIQAFSTASVAGDKSITLTNLMIRRAGFGLNFGGPTLALRDSDIVVEGCDFGAGPNSVDRVTTPIRMSNGINNYIVNNDIQRGFALGAAPEAFSIVGIDMAFGGLTNMYITHNMIHDLERASGSSGSVLGIGLGGAGAATLAGSNYRINNNFIWDLRCQVVGTGNSTRQYGFYAASATPAGSQGAVRFYNNTVSNNFTPPALPVTNGHAGAVLLSAQAADGYRYLNNIYQVFGAWPGGHGTLAMFTLPLLNDANVFHTDGDVDLIGGSGTLAAWQGASGQEANSHEGDPGLYSGSNLHVDQTTVGFVSNANNGGYALGFLTDIDKEGRDLSTPDIGADEFTPIPWPDNAVASAVHVPGTAGIPAGKTNIKPTATIRNNGSNTNDIPVRFVLNDGFFDVFNEVVVIQGVPPLTDYNIDTEFPNLPPLVAGNYTARLTTELVGDDDMTNDTLATTTAAIFKVVGTYSTDFEPGNETGWSHASEGGAIDDWILGTPNKGALASSAHSGINAWVTKLTGNYSANSHAAVYSPYFDLSNVPFPIVKFWHNYSWEVGWDNGRVEYTVDNGATWNAMGAFADPKGINWYEDGGGTDYYLVPGFTDSAATFYGAGTPYHHSQYYSKDIGGQEQVRFRFTYVGDGLSEMSGWVFDDFEINEAPSVSGKVYNDVDNSGTFNAGDVGISGAEVYLGGDASDTTTTNLSGDYAFENIIEGNYTVATNVVAGSNVTPGGPGTYAIPLVKDQPVTANFGYYNPAEATGNVWYDKNHNQLKDGSEAGMSGVQVNATGAGTANATTNIDGDYSITLQVAGNYALAQDAVPSGHMQVFPKVGGYNVAVTYGDSIGGNNFGNSAAATATEFRTGTYADWATAVNYKLKQKAEDRKNHIVELKFVIVAPRSGFTGFELDFGMLTDGEVTEGTAKAVSVGGPFTGAKKYTFTTAIDSADTFQIDAIGLKGKVAKVKVKWLGRTEKPLTVKETLVNYIANNPHPRMPNLNNVVEELFGGPKKQPQPSSFPTGLLVGTPQGVKLGNSVIHFKLGDIYKSLITKGVMHSATDGCLDLIGGKPMLKQQKSLPQAKVDSKEFAALLTAKLNVAASVLNKFPNGLGELVYLDKTNPLNPFNDQSVNDIIAKGDSIISCLPVTTKDSVPTTEDLYNVLTAINGAFSGPVDTITYATKTTLTGVADLKSCTFLYAVPGVIPASIIPGNVVADQTPDAYELNQNYPNPFNPTTTIDFNLPQYGMVTLKVYNMLGQEVATLLDNVEFEDGQQSVDFDASGIASGVYFYRLTVQGLDDEGAVEGQSFSQVKKMLLVK